MELTIPWTPVKALLNLAGKADQRKYVNGIWIDRQGSYIVIWATTGAIAGAIRTEEPSTDGPDVFLPRHIVEACKSFVTQAAVKREDDGRMSISCMGTTHYWQDEAFAAVDWRRVIPAAPPGAQAQHFDATLLAPFVKAREVLHGKSSGKVAGGVMLGHRAEGISVQLLDVPEFVGVLMPLRSEVVSPHFRTSRPEWVAERGRVALAKSAAADLV